MVTNADQSKKKFQRRSTPKRAHKRGGSRQKLPALSPLSDLPSVYLLMAWQDYVNTLSRRSSSVFFVSPLLLFLMAPTLKCTQAERPQTAIVCVNDLLQYARLARRVQLLPFSSSSLCPYTLPTRLASNPSSSTLVATRLTLSL